MLAIRIHKLLNAQAEAGTFGPNPLAKIKHGTSGKMLNTIAPTANPSGSNSKEVYADIQKNIESWIEQAIEIRKAN